MKKVLLVIPSLLQGGGQKFVLDLAQKLDKNKYTVKILIYYDAVADCFQDIIYTLNNNGLEIIRMNKNPGLDFSFFKSVKRFVKEYNPDIIHTHLDTLLYLFPTFNKRQIKLHTVHSIAEKESRGLQRLVRKIAFRFFKVKPIAISDTVAESIKKCFKIKVVPVVYNGVICENYSGEKKQHEGINFIAVGTLYEVKNYGYLIDCFYELIKKYSDVSLTILGDGPLKNNLKNPIDEFGISNKIFLVGAVSDVKNYLLNADVFVSSSLYEGLPLSMLEAMAAGLPIVTNDVGGIHDILKDGYNGYLVPLGEKEKYIEALERLILDSNRRGLFSENAKKLATNYDESNTIELYEKLYETK